MTQQRFTFPRWTNLTLPAIAVVGATAPLYVAVIVAYGLVQSRSMLGTCPNNLFPTATNCMLVNSGSTVGTVTTLLSTQHTQQFLQQKHV